jgi:hypothetical protein
MKSEKEVSGNDFSIIFKEIEKFHEENPTYFGNLLTEEDIQNDNTIREFREICQEISSSSESPAVYMTFS